MDLALTVRRRRSTIPRLLVAAVRPVKGTNRSGTPATAITDTTDGARETSVVAAGSGSRTDHEGEGEGEEAVKAVRAVAAENRHRARQSLR
jgi:hypothetical protein